MSATDRHATRPRRPRPPLGRVQPRPSCGLELRRMLRNRRTVIFTLVMPPVFFLLFGTAPATRPSRRATATSPPTS